MRCRRCVDRSGVAGVLIIAAHGLMHRLETIRSVFDFDRRCGSLRLLPATVTPIALVSTEGFFMKETFESIDRDRRLFLGVAAFTLAAAQPGLIRPASAQSKAAGRSASEPDEFFPGFSAETIQTSGTTIHVLRKGTGRPLLLLHGYPETHLTWHKVAPKLAEQFAVVVPDLRGYGDSGKPEGGERHENYSFRAMAPDQVDVMRHFGHDRFLVAAQDRGARVTHRLCLDHPEKVEKACLMDIAPTLTMYDGTNKEFASKYM